MPETPRSVHHCGRVRHAELVSVALYRDPSGGPATAAVEGVQRCGSVHECPSCARAILTERAREVTGVLELARDHGYQLYLVTLTLRHGVGDVTRDLLVGLRRAWRRLTSGGKWARFTYEFGAVEHVRALETTYGVNGAHPHIHAVLAIPPVYGLDGWRRADAGVAEMVWDDGDWRWPRPGEKGDAVPRAEVLEMRLYEWFASHWPDAVARELGERHRPNAEHGVDVQLSHKPGDYITKLGLEVTLDTKEGKRGRTPLQVLSDWVDNRDTRDWRLWRQHVDAWKGERRLTWSRGAQWREWRELVRAEMDLAAELAGREEVGILEADEWDDLVCFVPAFVPSLLEAAELGGAAAVTRYLDLARRIVDAHPRMEPAPPPRALSPPRAPPPRTSAELEALSWYARAYGGA